MDESDSEAYTYAVDDLENIRVYYPEKPGISTKILTGQVHGSKGFTGVYIVVGIE